MFLIKILYTFKHITTLQKVKFIRNLEKILYILEPLPFLYHTWKMRNLNVFFAHECATFRASNIDFLNLQNLSFHLIQKFFCPVRG